MTIEKIKIWQKLKLWSIPKFMYAQTIREERFWEPINAFKKELIEVPKVWKKDVLVYIMAAWVNYNNVWASLWKPINVINKRNKKWEKEKFHIWWSDGAWIVWCVWDEVTNVKIWDEVILHCWRWDNNESIDDHAFSNTQHIWWYESNYWSFSQFWLVQEHQCLLKPWNLSWTDSAGFMLTWATAYRMLYWWEWNKLQKGSIVLVWWWAWWVWSMAIQLIKNAWWKAIAVVSSKEKAEYCMKIWAYWTINRKNYKHWWKIPDINNNKEYLLWLKWVKKFQNDIYKIVWVNNNPDIVIEHPWEMTLPTSCYVAKTWWMIVICAWTTWYTWTFDLRYHWMHQKRLQWSHFANTKQCRKLLDLVKNNKIDTCCNSVFKFSGVNK